ncbi:WD40/YVTN/BNR-like repeat-containing protein [Shewanella carassii]|uniref:Uncharacterized protein n=1 Tax=Shewanella carassii TaxID=1987584 RepID=A0ABQ1SW83_9GAMM|nr:hypothetical protein [Shewanella carassii]GGE65483.1 hypothetical protein GCM10011520_02800 [Shewanella carassii]
MIFRTRLKAGLPNVFNKAGKYFYLLTAADAVEIRFRDENPQTNSVDFKSEMREGMSADFEIGVTEVELLSQSDQYVEFWLGKTKLDYSRLALGGASSQIDSGRAVCELGSSLAIPADFRRKAITLQALADVTIGGIGVTAATGYALKTGESIKLNSRGDVYTYLTPARIDQIQTSATYIAAPAASDDANGFQHIDIMECFFYDKTTNRLSTGYSKMVYSDDGGANWIDSNVNIAINGDPSNLFHQLGQTQKGLFVVKGYYGRIGVSRDGGKNWDYFASIQQSLNIETGEPIVGAGFAYGGWISGDEKNIVVICNDGLWETFDAGKSWINYQDNVGIGFGAGIAITKRDNVIYVVDGGGLYVYDYQTKKFIKKHNEETAGGDDSIAIIGAKIYWYNSSTQKLKYSENGGDTIKSNQSLTAKARYIAQFGESVIIGGLDKLGIIKRFGDEIEWFVPDTLSGKTWSGNRIVITEDSIIVKQSSPAEDVDPKAAVYPMGAVAGASLPVPLQWLAELN